MAVEGHLAPFAVAFLDRADHAGLDNGDFPRFRVRFGKQVDLRILAALPGRGDRRASAGKQRLVDPALGAVRIAHAPPIVVFLDDLHRQARLQVEPVDRIVEARSDTRVDAAGFQADEARQRQAARAARHDPAGRRGRAAAARRQRAEARARPSSAAPAVRRSDAKPDTFVPLYSAPCRRRGRAHPFSLSSAEPLVTQAATPGPVLSFACLG